MGGGQHSERKRHRFDLGSTAFPCRLSPGRLPQRLAAETGVEHVTVRRYLGAAGQRNGHGFDPRLSREEGARLAQSRGRGSQHLQGHKHAESVELVQAPGTGTQVQVHGC